MFVASNFWDKIAMDVLNAAAIGAPAVVTTLLGFGSIL